MNRRDFVKAAGLVPLLGSMPELLFANQRPKGQRVLLLVDLDGGNDGLNTLVPHYQQGKYEEYRPTLAQPRSRTLDLGSDVGMHDALQPLKSFWDRREMAWIQNVGYPKPDRSHFRSKDIWETASNSDYLRDEGWLSAVLPDKDTGLHGVVVGSGLGPLTGKGCRAVAMHDPKTFVNQAKLVSNVQHKSNNPSLTHLLDVQDQLHGAKKLIENANNMDTKVNRYFKRSSFNNDLSSVAKMIVGGSDATVYKVKLSGFDTHSNQEVAHKNQLKYLAEGLESFAKVMKAFKLWDQVLVMTYSEFGRRVKENNSRGTDHGTSAPLLVMGGRVAGRQLFGTRPDLNKLDKGGDLRFSTDFRKVYGTVATRWLGQKNPWSGYGTIPFI
ncbi:MAG: DUF1501 domain-containing protein [Thiotrichaceae bacterium]|nr:DUF1501 domain-containing protein [Thiotrichaceae bacterium]